MTNEEIENLIKERDYYKARYLEFNNAFIKGGKKLNIEAMLKDLEKRYEVYRKEEQPMLDQAISLIEKQIEMYKVQIKNVASTLEAKNRTVINRNISKLKKEVEIRKYILRILKENKKTCLHCDSGEPSYCENCYQELIAENMKLKNKDYYNEYYKK